MPIIVLLANAIRAFYLVFSEYGQCLQPESQQ
jgi:hypothetical protein